MKKIKLYGMAPDNVGDHHPAGTVLTVDDDGREGCIDAARAKHLVGINSASALTDEKAKEPAKPADA